MPADPQRLTISPDLCLFAGMKLQSDYGMDASKLTVRAMAVPLCIRGWCHFSGISMRDTDGSGHSDPGA